MNGLTTESANPERAKTRSCLIRMGKGDVIARVVETEDGLEFHQRSFFYIIGLWAVSV